LIPMMVDSIFTYSPFISLRTHIKQRYQCGLGGI
jgi:hypothetical protein